MSFLGCTFSFLKKDKSKDKTRKQQQKYWSVFTSLDWFISGPWCLLEINFLRFYVSDKVFCLYFGRIFSLDIVFSVCRGSFFFVFHLSALTMLSHCLVACISDRKCVTILFSFFLCSLWQLFPCHWFSEILLWFTLV